VIFSSINSTLILKSVKLTSTKTGVALTYAIASAVAKNDQGVVITSSFSPIFSASKAITNASVPLPTLIACFAPTYLAISNSNFFTFGPLI
jgi:hypothetical protein